MMRSLNLTATSSTHCPGLEWNSLTRVLASAAAASLGCYSMSVGITEIS